jgi:hypothetical protein
LHAVFGNPRGAPLPIEEANLAQLDTNLALKWTADNIGRFGGDASKSQYEQAHVIML